MKEHYAIRVHSVFNFTEHNIKPNDVCWNKIKMIDSKWIACCYRTNPNSSNKTNNNDSPNNPYLSGSHSSFNTLGGRRYKWSPSISSDSCALIKNKKHLPPHPSGSLSSSICLNGDCGTINSRSSISSGDRPSTRPGGGYFYHYDLSYAARYKSKDDSIIRESSSSPQSIIKLINPLEDQFINCETNQDTNCAQVSPDQETIALSNDYWLAFYSIRDNDCLGTVQFPNRCIYWTWINGDTVAIITEKDVYHWCLTRQANNSRDYLPKKIFSLDEEIRNKQIINYIVDPLYEQWCAITALGTEDGEICGTVQVFSYAYMQSQCINAHSCQFVSYQFEGSSNPSNLLLCVKRENRDLWKLYIIELSPISNAHCKNRPLKSQQLMLHGLRDTGNNNMEDNSLPEQISEDIPTHLICDNDIGLIFILSKYGFIYICDLETATPLYCDSLQSYTKNSAIFSVSYDPKNALLLAICRNGHVFAIKILLKKLIDQKINPHKIQSSVYNRISEKIRTRKINRLNSNVDNLNQEESTASNQNNNHHTTNNTRTVSIMINNKSNTGNDDNSESENSSDKLSFVGNNFEEFEEEITRL